LWWWWWWSSSSLFFPARRAGEIFSLSARARPLFFLRRALFFFARALSPARH
jgi:hypothetical protein